MERDNQVELKNLAAFMRDNGLVLVTAESCTAGLIAATMADVEGAGKLLECAFVTYMPGAKMRCLGVREETIGEEGLTSEAVAREMALGALQASNATVAIANTGVADDTDPAVPAGTQCFAWAFRRRDDGEVRLLSATQRFDGDRRAIREAAALHALTRIPWAYEASSAR